MIFVKLLYRVLTIINSSLTNDDNIITMNDRSLNHKVFQQIWCWNQLFSEIL